MQNDSRSSGGTEDRISRVLPYVVGLLFAFGLLIYNAGWGSRGVNETSAELIDAASAGAPVGAVRAALASEEFAGVVVTSADGTIVLSGSVADQAAREAAGEAALEVAGGAPVDNRLEVTSLTASASTVPLPPGDSSEPVTAAASTIAPTTAAPTTAAPTTVAPTTVAPTAPPPAPVAETTTAPAPVPETAAAVPPPTAEELNLRLAELLRAEPIQFGLLRTKVDPASSGTLVRAAAVIMSSPSARFEIQGHTDSGGQPSFNQRLSDERAAAVRDALVARGVPADRLTARGYGETSPVARNATPEGRSLNRRVEIVVIP